LQPISTDFGNASHQVCFSIDFLDLVPPRGHGRLALHLLASLTYLSSISLGSSHHERETSCCLLPFGSNRSQCRVARHGGSLLAILAKWNSWLPTFDRNANDVEYSSYAFRMLAAGSSFSVPSR
jgi:hypothetical protein